VRLRNLGKTTEGRDFLQAVITSADNMQRLEELRRLNHVLADPRGTSAAQREEAVTQGKVTLFITPSMHSTETAATEFAMQFAWELATSDAEPWKSAREELVVVLFPTLNPDGLDHVVHWYREHVGSPYEASGLLELYQHYAGHDNNRDWFMLTQAETRLVTRELYDYWYPQVYWDVHQQGSKGERMFVPPFRDPLNPNLDPGVVTSIDLLGTRALYDMTQAGYTGLSTGVSYDMWWNGGNRSVPVRHNIVGLLTEAASVRIATPLFLPLDELGPPSGLESYAPSNRFPAPWPGGWWRLRDIIDYELAFGRSLLGSLASEPGTWRRGALAASERALARGRAEGPRGWLIPSDNRDPAAVRRLVQLLLWSGIEVRLCAAELELDGRRWPAGSLVLRRDQPYGAHLKDLFEVQRYPAGPPPYDVSGWTLPLMLGVRRVEVMGAIPDDLARVTSVNDAVAAFAGDPRLAGIPRGWLSAAHSDTWTAVARQLAAGERLTWIGAEERAGLFVPGEAVSNVEEQGLVLDALPRIGLYAPWRGHMPEGWNRWVFDAWSIPYTRVRNEMVRGGELGAFLDVLVLPGNSARELDGGRAPGSVPGEYARGLDPEGAVAIEEFVRAGGTLVASAGSAEWVIELLELPLVDVTREHAEFSCPGSVLRGVPEDAHPWTAGLPESVALFFSGGVAWRGMTKEEAEAAGRPGVPAVTTVLRYADTRTLLSGWIQEPAAIGGRAAWVTSAYGAGRVHLFGFRPQYRGWTQQAAGLLFRALFLNP
jgi:hypothetical protein